MGNTSSSSPSDSDIPQGLSEDAKQAAKQNKRLQRSQEKKIKKQQQYVGANAVAAAAGANHPVQFRCVCRDAKLLNVDLKGVPGLLTKGPTLGVRKYNAGTGRCDTCNGVVLQEGYDLSIPNCSWHDATVPLGSLVTSMVAAQRNFSESLKQVQSEDQPLVMLAKMTNFDMPTIRALQGVFQKISDHDGKDNLISAQELCLATGIPPDSILGKALFRLMDITRSNNINFRTWVLMLSKLSPMASIEDKISFAFNIYDDNGDGFIDKPDLIAMLRSIIPDLSEQDALQLIESLFDVADQDGDRRIDFDDYRSLVVNSQAFYDSMTIDIATVLRQHYNVISEDQIAERVFKLQERDLRQDERANRETEKEQVFMEREHEDVKIVDNLDDLDL